MPQPVRVSHLCARRSPVLEERPQNRLLLMAQRLRYNQCFGKWPMRRWTLPTLEDCHLVRPEVPKSDCIPITPSIFLQGVYSAPQGTELVFVERD